MRTEIIDADAPASCESAIIEPNERKGFFTLRLRRADGEEFGPFRCPLDQILRLVRNLRPPHLYIRRVDAATRATLLRAFDVEDSHPTTAPQGPTVH